MSQTKWNDGFYLQTYLLIRNGNSEKKIAQTLGVSLITFQKWKDSKPYLKEAIDKAKQDPKKQYNTTFKDYILGKLSPEVKDIWDRVIMNLEVEGGFQKNENIFKEQGRLIRQQIFIYALLSNSFNLTEACRITNTAKRTVDYWVEEDYEFAQLLDEIQWHKKNFFENALIDKAAEGDASCIIFANKTLNKDRGYTEPKAEINFNQNNITNNTINFRIDDLELPLNTRREILAAIQKHKQESLLPSKKNVELIEVKKF